LRRVVKLTFIVTAVVLAVVGGSLYTIYRASQRVPEFYRAAMAVVPEIQEPARDAFVAQATALAGDLSHDGPWRSLFTAEQVNAWLALELAASYPELLPGEFHDPRITFRDNEATIGCRYQSGELSVVLSLVFDVYLQEPNVVALRVRRVRAGALPVPLAQVLDGMSQAARELNLQLQWAKSHGDPVALITLPRPRDSHEALSLESLELHEGVLFVAGRVGQPKIDGSPRVPETPRTPTAERESPVGDQPRVGAAETETRQK